MKVEYAVQNCDTGDWRMETHPYDNEESARDYMRDVTAIYPGLKFRIVCRLVHDWAPLDDEGGEK